MPESEEAKAGEDLARRSITSTYAAAFLMLADVSAVRVMSELVAVGRGRTEITLLAVAPAATQASVMATTKRLAQILVARARA